MHCTCVACDVTHLGLGQSRLLHLQLRLEQLEVLGPAFGLGVAGAHPEVIVQRHRCPSLPLVSCGHIACDSTSGVRLKGDVPSFCDTWIVNEARA